MILQFIIKQLCVLTGGWYGFAWKDGTGCNIEGGTECANSWGIGMLKICGFGKTTTRRTPSSSITCKIYPGGTKMGGIAPLCNTIGTWAGPEKKRSGIWNKNNLKKWVQNSFKCLFKHIAALKTVEKCMVNCTHTHAFCYIYLLY